MIDPPIPPTQPRTAERTPIKISVETVAIIEFILPFPLHECYKFVGEEDKMTTTPTVNTPPPKKLRHMLLDLRRPSDFIVFIYLPSLLLSILLSPYKTSYNSNFSGFPSCEQHKYK
jgi:hypothetical protein